MWDIDRYVEGGVSLEWLNKVLENTGNVVKGLGHEVSAGMWDTTLRWMYTAIYDAVAQFFTSIGSMGVEIFGLPWVGAVTRLFSLFGWGLFLAGLVVAVFDLAIAAQSGRVSVRDTALNTIKGLMAVSLFTTLPVELYKFCISLQGTFMGDLARVFAGGQSLNIGDASMSVLQASFAVANQVTLSVFNLLAMIAMAYCVVKLFFANIKRGGILLIQIAVGAMYMFSVPRGFTDGFWGWCKQVAALCLTAFLQTTLLFLGLLTFNVNMLLGLGLLLSANEVPRIAQQFGLDTSARVSLTSVIHHTTTAVNLTRSVVGAMK